MAALESHRAAPARARATGSRAAGAGRAATAKPKLKVLNQQAIRQRARRRNLLVVLFIVVLVGFFAVALVQAQLVADQQDLDVMRARIAEAESANAKMVREVEEASSPAVIVDRATRLGMVRAFQPVYLTAVAPVRDIPVVPAVQPELPETFELAAPGLDIPADQSPAMDASDLDSWVETTLAPPPATQVTSQEVAVTAPPTTVAVATAAPQTTAPPVITATTPRPVASVAGTSAFADGSGQAAPQNQGPAAVPVEAKKNGVAGLTAVAGGSGSG